MDMDDFYMRAYELIEEELGREPTEKEISALAQALYESSASAAYDRLKDRMKYGDE